MNRGGQTPPAGGPPVGGEGTGLAPNIASLLCYLIGAPFCLPLTGIVFLVIEKQNADVRFHAWQSVSFGAFYAVLMMALWFFSLMMGTVASVLEYLVKIFWPLLFLAALILWIICLVKAYQGERWRIPVIGDFAAKQAGI